MAQLRQRYRRRTGGWRENPYFKSFFYAFTMAFLLFIPFIFADGGRFLYYGDFNVQQITFYRLCHDAVRSGNMGWSHLTDLGANFVGSYSFYLLGSPFFWLTIPFPGEWLQFLMGPLLMLKIACCSLTAYIYLQRYAKNKVFAVLCAILYAFSGYSVFNIFFNHFHEAMVFFPLLLWSLDEYMYNRRRGIFALCAAACCIVNYYFFVGMVTFCVIYWLVRMLCKSWTLSFKDFLLLALEAVLGLGIACVLLLPSIYAVLQNDRVDSAVNGWSALLYGNEQRYLHIFSCFFFPPDIPARANITPDSNAKWASVGAWLPLFSMTGVIGFLQLHKKHWLKKIIWILFLMAMVPILNSMFQLFNSAYYARWFYMLTLMLCMATMVALETQAVNWKRSITWTTVITAAISFGVGLMPNTITKNGESTTTYGLEAFPARYWSYVAIALCSLALLAFLFKFYRKRGQKAFARALLLGAAFVSVLYSAFILVLGKTQINYTWDHLIPYELNGGADVNIDDLSEVRSDFYESVDNAGMFWEIPTIQAFHSIVPGSVMKFYQSIGVTRDVASRPEVSHYGLRGLTSVKYLFDSTDDTNYFGKESLDSPAMPGWTYVDTRNGYDIWENEYYIPMGFTYTQYATQEEYEAAPQDRRDLFMLKALVLDDEQVQKYGSLLEHADVSSFTYSNEDYFKDCTDRQTNTCSAFAYTNTGFEAEITTKKETLVFFSVPYEGGWSATVNGKAADIEQVNVGFMAVAVPEGTSEIVFTYKTPWLAKGVWITICSLIGLAAYCYVARRVRLQKQAVRMTLPPKKPLRRMEKFSAYKKRVGAMFSSVPTQQQAAGKEPDVLPDLPDSVETESDTKVSDED